jgi:hypothetical protein
MKPYGQYCPIARASQVLAERWTPIILRNLLLGSTTFSEIRRRPQDLADPAHHPAPRAGAGRRRPDDAQPQRTWVPLPAHRGRKGPGGRHEGPGELGRALDGAGPEHLDPGVVLHSWVSWYLARERLPERRVIARFQFPGLPRKDGELWIIFDGQRSEVCRKDPGFEVELYVQAEPAALAEWHLGRIEWADALRAERIRVLGPATLARALPTWNRRSPAAWARQA